MKLANHIKIIAVIAVLLASLGFSKKVGAQGFKGKSSMTGQKFKVHKKPVKKKPLNYINSIQLVGGIGPTTYYGELCDGLDCFIPRWGAALGAQYRINELMSVRGELNYIRLAADDSYGVNKVRNLNFRSNNFEFSAVVIGEVFRYNKMYRRRHVISPYYFTGIGIVSYNPMGQDPLDDSWVALRQFQTEGVDYSNFALTVPYGAGLRFKVNPILNISMEFGYRWTFTDYLDDVSNVYPDMNSLSEQGQRLSNKELLGSDLSISQIENDPTFDPVGRKRGNPSRNDGYFMFTVKAEYTIKVTRQHYNINSNVSRFRTIKSVKKK